MEKRNTAVDLTDLAIGILILGIVVTIGANILIGVRDSRLTDLPILSVSNETTGLVNETGTELSNIWVTGVTACSNTTTQQVINSGNYTLTIGGTGVGTLTYSSPVASAWNNSAWNCTYTHYDTTSAQWALPDSAATGLAEYGNWFDIIVIVGVAAVILSIIFLAFGRPGQEQGGVSY